MCQRPCWRRSSAKTDLVTGMVGEFPELQGLMGRYYALDQEIDPEVADAIRDHYKPQGPSDSIPVSKIGQAVALADKLDTLVGFWAIDEKPTGSKDPYALAGVPWRHSHARESAHSLRSFILTIIRG